MKPEDLLDAVGGIGTDLVEDAETVRKKPWAAIRWCCAAILVLCLGGGLLLMLSRSDSDSGASASGVSASAVPASAATASAAPTSAVRPAENSDHDRTSQNMCLWNGKLFFCDSDSILCYDPETELVTRICDWSGTLQMTTSGVCAVDSELGAESVSVYLVDEDGLNHLADIETSGGEYDSLGVLDIQDGIIYWSMYSSYFDFDNPANNYTEIRLGTTEISTGESSVSEKLDISGEQFYQRGKMAYSFIESSLTFSMQSYSFETGATETLDVTLDGFPETAAFPILAYSEDYTELALADITVQLLPENTQYEISSYYVYDDFILLACKVSVDTDMGQITHMYYYKVTYDGTATLLCDTNMLIETCCRDGDTLYFSAYAPILWDGGTISLMSMDLNTGELTTVVDSDSGPDATELFVMNGELYYYTPYLRGIYHLDPDTGESTLLY